MGEVIPFLPFKLAKRMEEAEFVRVIPENGGPSPFDRPFDPAYDYTKRAFPPLVEPPADCPA